MRVCMCVCMDRSVFFCYVFALNHNSCVHQLDIFRFGVKIAVDMSVSKYEFVLLVDLSDA